MITTIKNDDLYVHTYNIVISGRKLTTENLGQMKTPAVVEKPNWHIALCVVIFSLTSFVRK